MAYALSQSNPVLGRILAPVTAAFSGFGKVLEAMTVAYSQSHEFEALMNLTDAELQKKHGLKREDIAAYVFRDKLS